MSKGITPATVAAAATFAFAGFQLILAGEAAQAASPTYCALYGREYGLATVQPAAAPGMLASVQNQAYYRCLNQDEDPPLPSTSAYAGREVTTSPANPPAIADAGTTSIAPPKPQLASAPPPPAPRASPPARSTPAVSGSSSKPPSRPQTTAVASTAPASSPSSSLRTAYADDPAPPTDAAPKPKSALSALVDVFFPPAPQAKPAAATQAAAPVQVAQASASTYPPGYHGSGQAAWTPEWKSWCARNFPNSWDPKTGTVLNHGSDTRELCR